MQAVEFEAEIIDNKIEIPTTVKGLSAKHVKVIVLLDDESGNKYDFSGISGRLQWDEDEMKAQRMLRDEW